MSDYERVKAAVSLQEYAEDNLQRAGRSFVCPACQSGTGANKTPAFSIRGDSFKCFSCGAGGDVFDLAGILNGTDSKAEQLEAVARWGGVALSEARANREKKTANHERTTKERRKSEAVPDYSDGIKAEAQRVAEWAANIENPEAVRYLEGRGFTLDQAKAWGFGYDPVRKRLIIPYRGSKHYHIDRDVTGTASHKYEKPKSDLVGKQPLENPKALKAPAVFIVEGLIDALAVEACGFPSIALNGTGWREVAERIASERYQGAVIVSLDNDEAGQTATLDLLAYLKDAGIQAQGGQAVSRVSCKDAGEAYAKDREALAEALGLDHEDALARARYRKDQEYNAALKRLRVLDPSDVLQRLYLLDEPLDFTPTGFKSLDGYLGGGITYGYLYIFGAISSLGKTTLTLQIADNIAASGRPVLFVTIEQSADEIVAKSLSRIMRTNKDERGRYTVVSSQDIASRVQREAWGESHNIALLKAAEIYSRDIAPNMRILEGHRQPSVSDIRAAAQMIADKTDMAPAIFIDYLQLLAPPDERDTDKQATDKNVMSLRQLARDLKAPVFAISSLNRSSYSGAIDLSSFKESGAIEYGADLLLGLQPEGIASKLDEVSENKMRKEANRITEAVKNSTERACELIIIKNRHGRMTGTRNGIPLTFYPVTNLFEEKDT